MKDFSYCLFLSENIDYTLQPFKICYKEMHVDALHIITKKIVAQACDRCCLRQKLSKFIENLVKLLFSP